MYYVVAKNESCSASFSMANEHDVNALKQLLRAGTSVSASPAGEDIDFVVERVRGRRPKAQPLAHETNAPKRKVKSTPVVEQKIEP